MSKILLALNRGCSIYNTRMQRAPRARSASPDRKQHDIDNACHHSHHIYRNQPTTGKTHCVEVREKKLRTGNIHNANVRRCDLQLEAENIPDKVSLGEVLRLRS